MPHLSPMNWMCVSFILWVIMIFALASLWWMQSPSFSEPTISNKDSMILPWG